MPRKYKPIPKCPHELEPIIHGVNLLPPDAVKLVEAVALLAEKVNQSAFMESWSERDKIQFEFEAIVGNKILSDLLIGESKILRINEADETLRHFEQSKRILHYIAKKNHYRREQVKITAIDCLIDYNRLADLRKPPNFVVFFDYSDRHGAPIVKKPPLLEMVENGSAETFCRVAVCPICDSVYWFKKTNAKTCGETKCIDDLQNEKKRQKRIVG